MSRFLLAAALLAISVASPWDCDPLVPEVCGYPFPNNFWLDEASKTLNITVDTFPISREGRHINPYQGGWNTLDGFSPLGMIFTFFAHLDNTTLPKFTNISASLDSNCPSALINIKTGEPVAHWTEEDHSADDVIFQEYNRSLIMWPARRLEDSESYIVAYRNLKNKFGDTIAPSPAFEAIRSGQPSADPTVNARRARYNDVIFPALAKLGWKQDEVVLAWDFTVSSTRTQTHRMVSIRDDAFARINVSGIPFTIDKVEENPSPSALRKIQGKMTVPWYLTERLPGFGVRLNIATDDVNLPIYNGDAEVTFSVVIPNCVKNGTKLGLMSYGHGLFGSQSEIDTSYLQEEADRYGYLLMATDWLGLAKEDVVTAAEIISSDLTAFAAIPDRSHQGMLNALLMMKLAQTSAFYTSEHMLYNGESIVNTSNRFYYGNSQGGIYGHVYMATTTDVRRGVLGVAGGPYSLLLPRSADFAALFDILKARYTNPMDRIFLMAAVQLLWDRLEPASYLSHISKEPLPNTPTHRVILHYGLSDAQVTWLGGLTTSRSFDAHMYRSNVRSEGVELYGFPFHDDDEVITDDINFVVGWDFLEPKAPYVNIPVSRSYDTHEKTRRTLTAQEQTFVFLTQGIIINPCKGPCRNVSH